MSSKPVSFLDLLGDRRIIVVVRHHDAGAAEAIARAAAAGGLRAVEITTSVPGAAALIEALRATLAPDVLVGAGTVLSQQQLDEVLSAGAAFVVAPGLDREILERCCDAGTPFLPAALTPTEVMAARALGLDALKLFPANTVGPAHLSALRSVFPETAFIPTGGVTGANAGGWFAAGAQALGLAGELHVAHRAGGDGAVRDLARRLAESFETDGSTQAISGFT